ncbi:hypothetical protein NLI96_g4163 [Meripilus lineatus]|uniref:F-box domain-containing protein n=1 Tax=Meripilus lineatus TaxID=2056292 RepID=A0AAD5YKC5_9APHY|nr:hypothetical protein NLI96_g4163 [Physisporinus lineatus]
MEQQMALDALRLFPELIFYVSWFLQDDMTTLRSLALTSKIWHAASLPHLFHRITFDRSRTQKENLSLFEELLNSNPGIHPELSTLTYFPARWSEAWGVNHGSTKSLGLFAKGFQMFIPWR